MDNKYISFEEFLRELEKRVEATKLSLTVALKPINEVMEKWWMSIPEDIRQQLGQEYSERPTMAEIFFDLARSLARRSTCSSRIAVGAVLVDENNRIVATGYNGSPRGLPHCDDEGCDLDKDGHCRRAIHAEENAILQCAHYGIRTQGLILYCTHSPCHRCAMKLYQAGIIRVYFLEPYQGSRMPTELDGRVRWTWCSEEDPT